MVAAKVTGAKVLKVGLGPDYAHGVAGQYFNTRKPSIYGGSNEIQRNIIAKLVLGL